MSYPKDQSKLTTERIDKYEFQKCVLEILTLVMTFGLLKMIIIETHSQLVNFESELPIVSSLYEVLAVLIRSNLYFWTKILGEIYLTEIL